MRKASENSKTIIRVKKNNENPYVMLDNRIFSDTDLSWKAKGILSYLLSKPDNWVISVSDLVKRSKDGRDAVYAGLKELQDAGYITREVIRGTNGRIESWEYTIFETAQTPTSGKSVSGSTSGFSGSGKSRSGKTDTNNTDVTNTDLTKIEEEEKEIKSEEKKNDDGASYGHQGNGKDEGTAKESTAEISNIDLIKNLESDLITNPYAYLAEREGATAEDLVASIKYLKTIPGMIKSPVAVLTEAIKREKTNRELAAELKNRPDSEKPVVTPKDKKPVKSTRAKADFPTKTPNKYDKFYL